MTPARPTSEPVPAVVGTATTGAILSAIGARPPIADILEVPERAGLPGHEGDDLAGIEPRAAAEGDDAVMLAGAEDGDAGLDIGVDRVRLHVGEHRHRHACLLENADGRSVIAILARPASVTSSGRSMPAARQASASSLMRPAPKRTEVG